MSEDVRSVVLGGKRMVDVRHLFPPAKRYQRQLTQIEGVAVHHDGVLMAAGDRDYNGTTLDEDVERLRAIYGHAFREGWDRMPYHLAATPNGRLFYILDLHLIGAHVGGHNTPLVGLVLLGNFMEECPTNGAVCAAGAGIAATWRAVGKFLPFRPHREWSETLCPGDTWPLWVGTLMQTFVYQANNELVSGMGVAGAVVGGGGVGGV